MAQALPTHHEAIRHTSLTSVTWRAPGSVLRLHVGYLGAMWGIRGSLPGPHRSRLGAVWGSYKSFLAPHGNLLAFMSASPLPNLQTTLLQPPHNANHHQSLACSGQRTSISNLKSGAGGRRPKALKYMYMNMCIWQRPLILCQSHSCLIGVSLYATYVSL